MTEETATEQQVAPIPVLSLDKVLTIYTRELQVGVLPLFCELVEKEHFKAAADLLPTLRKSLECVVDKFMDVAYYPEAQAPQTESSGALTESIAALSEAVKTLLVLLQTQPAEPTEEPVPTPAPEPVAQGPEENA